MEKSFCSQFAAAKWLAAIAIGALFALPIVAQYPGSPVKKPAVATEQKLRSTAVLEWIGEPGKPSASRIVPVAVWDGERYQDGGLYLAQPEPLAVQDGTEYELQRAGVPQGQFVIFRPGQVNRNWFGYGMWHPQAPKKVSTSRPSKTPPTVVTEVDPNKPSVSNKSKNGQNSGTGKDPGPATDSKTAPAPEVKVDVSDPDRPTLHKRGQADSAGNSSSTASASDDQDPDRPTLHKRGGTAKAVSAGTSERDPDRPDLHRGKPVAGDPALLASKLTGMPADLQQMVAISDSLRSDDHPFVYHWANPDDAIKMKAALEDLARKAIAGSTVSNATSSTMSGAGTNGSAKAVPAARPRTPRTAAARAAATRKSKAQVPAIMLNDENFNAFELSSSSGATLILTAHTGVGDAQKDVAIIAQPDFYGIPHLLLQSVSDDAHLDTTPRMRLVDAADTDGKNRAELIFELRGETDRQFAIYRVAGGRAEQVFVTESLPLGTTRD